MEQTRQIKQFQFYDFYAEILSGLNDESAGRIARLMCEYMFTDNAVADIKDNKERFYWGNIVDILKESIENELKGKQSTGLNRKMKHFTFQDNFYDAIKLLDDKQSGQYVKAICGYMFENKTPTLKPPTDGFLKRNPQIKNNIYPLSMRLTDGIDWTKLANKLPYSAYRDSTNLYQIVAHYKEIVGG